MVILTPSERRGAIVVALLLVLGAAHDLWRARPGREVAWIESPRGAPEADSNRAHTDENGSSGAPSHLPEPRARTQGVTPPVVQVALNRAGVVELERLPGVGPVLAARIVAHREAHGPFHRAEDLLAVRGIGPRLLERLRNHVVIER